MNDIIIDDLEFELEDEEIIKNKTKKKRILTISVLLIALVVINSYSGYHIINYINTLMVSTTIDNNFELDLNFGGKIDFDKKTFSKLQNYYFKNQELEFKACLTGHKKENNYYVTGMYFPKMIQQTVHSVRAEMCNKETIISLHTHPYLSCTFSEQDMKTYLKFKITNPNSIYGLMCAKNRFTFYGYET
mgnify:FL=1|jgi:proteasome lid subunit RPN8/RPN11